MRISFSNGIAAGANFKRDKVGSDVEWRREDAGLIGVATANRRLSDDSKLRARDTRAIHRFTVTISVVDRN